MVGWWGYYWLAQERRNVFRLEGWIRRQMRKCFWLRWHDKRGRQRALRPLGVGERLLRLVELMHQYLCGLLDPFVTLLEVYKLMYFMQEASEPLQLKFKQAPYGPYAENLRHVLHAIEGHLVSGYADGCDVPDKQLKLVPGATADAATFLEQHNDTRSRFDKVTALVEGFESPFGLELLSTVHWVMRHEAVDGLDDVVTRTYAWNPRKRQFTRRQIGIAVNVLSQKGWIEPLDTRSSG